MKSIDFRQKYFLNLNDWHLSPTKESGDGVNFETVMLIFMYWQPFIMQTRFKLEASKPRGRSKTRLK